MEITSQKKKLTHLKPMTLSPVALALAACGGGSSEPTSDNGSSENNDNLGATDGDQSNNNPTGNDEQNNGSSGQSAITFSSTRIDYEVTGFTADEINHVAMGGSDSKIFLSDREVGNLIITPHQDSLSPNANSENRYFPLIEYTLNEDGISVYRTVDNFNFVGSKPIDELTVNGVPAILFGGHGPEYTDGREWPFGDLWVAKLNHDSDIEYVQISTDRAFYHGISAGDINHDGLDDIVAVHMGLKFIEGIDTGSVHFFIQDTDGTFRKEILYSENPSLGGGSSILVSDLDGDGQNEILVASYGNGFLYADIEPGGEFSLREAPYSFHVMKYDSELEKVVTVTTMPLGGSMVEVNGNGGFGVIDIAEIDFDLDGDDDLLMLLENGNLEFTFEFYRNDGGLEFSLVTEQVFDSAYIDGTESIFRNINVVDIQSDGFPDFVLSGRNWWGQDGPVDLGQFVYINTGAQSFQSLGGNEGLIIDPLDFDLNGETEVIRTINFLEANDGELHFLLTQGGITALDFIDLRMDVNEYIV